MLMRHLQHAADLPCESDLARIDVVVELSDAGAHASLEVHHSIQLRPVLVRLRHFRMILYYIMNTTLDQYNVEQTYMALGGIINIGINTSLKDVLELLRLSMRLIKKPR